MAINNEEQQVELDLSLLRTRHPLGKGLFASYWRTTYDGDDVALKVANPRPKAAGSSTSSPSKTLDDAQQKQSLPAGDVLLPGRLLFLDAQAMLLFDHRHIVRCFGVALLPEGFLAGHSTPALAAALELCEPYTLKDLLTKSMAAGKRLFKIRQAYDWLLQVASALAYLHGRKVPIIHRDVKPDNILLKREPNGDLICKLSDFELHFELPYERAGELTGAVAASVNSPGRVPALPAYGAGAGAIFLENPCFSEDRSNKSQQPLSTISIASSDAPSTSGAFFVHPYPATAPAAGAASAVAEGKESPSPGSYSTAAAAASPRGVAAGSASQDVAAAPASGLTAARVGRLNVGEAGGESPRTQASPISGLGAASGSDPSSPSNFTVVDNRMCLSSSPPKRSKGGAGQQGGEGLATLSVVMSRPPNKGNVRTVLRRLAGAGARAGADLAPLSRTEMEAFYGLRGNSGSYMYMAPEVFRKQPYSEKSDVFSFGVIAYELLACELLLVSIFNTAKAARLGVHEPQEYASLVARGYRPPRIQKLSDAGWGLIEACWHQDPVERPSMATVVEELQRLVGELEDLGSSPGGDSQCVIS